MWIFLVASCLVNPPLSVSELHFKSFLPRQAHIQRNKITHCSILQILIISSFLPHRLKRICVSLRLSLKTLFCSSWTGRDTLTSLSFSKALLSVSECECVSLFEMHQFVFFLHGAVDIFITAECFKCVLVHLCVSLCRCFALIDSSTLEQTRDEMETDTQTHLESLVELGLSSTVSTILTQCSLEIYKVVH